MRSTAPLLLLGGAAISLLLLGAKKTGDDELRDPFEAPPDVKPDVKPGPVDDLDAQIKAEVARLEALRLKEEGQIATDAVKAAEAVEAAKRAAIEQQRKDAEKAKADEKHAPTKVQDAPSPRADTPTLPAGYDPARARAMARSVANHLANRKIAGYARELVREFQRACGITADGIYGGHTRGALIYFGASNPPRPFFVPTDTLPYVPPEMRK
jgi:peptidoglycan hydrolase-like protein with peptidoglycan-binding domain